VNIAFLDDYHAAISPHKDPVTAPLAVRAEGHRVVLLSSDPGFRTNTAISGMEAYRAESFVADAQALADIDCVVAISRFSPRLLPILTRMKAAGVPVVIKGDTDGTLGYPLRPNYLRMRPLRDDIRNALRHLKWRLPVRRWVHQKLAHIALADRVVLESPGAAANAVEVLEYWGLGAEIGKLRVIPNEVSQAVVDIPPNARKPKVVMAIGRWDDPRCKGADLLVPVLDTLLAARPDYSASVVGSGIEDVRRQFGARHPGRLSLLGETDFHALQAMTAGSARILLVPSRLESFSYVAAEALCGGASLAVTPIESLAFLAGGGA
jgi:glycosyltransferase involved in cell wall biosynthesis